MHNIYYVDIKISNPSPPSLEGNPSADIQTTEQRNISYIYIQYTRTYIICFITLLRHPLSKRFTAHASDRVSGEREKEYIVSVYGAYIYIYIYVYARRGRVQTFNEVAVKRPVCVGGRGKSAAEYTYNNNIMYIVFRKSIYECILTMHAAIASRARCTYIYIRGAICTGRVACDCRGGQKRAHSVGSPLDSRWESLAPEKHRFYSLSDGRNP